MSSISSVVNTSQAPGLEHRAPLSESDHEGPKRFEEVMRHESEDRADEARETGPKESPYAEDRVESEESDQPEGSETASGQDSEPKHDGTDSPEGDEEISDEAHIQALTSVESVQRPTVKASLVIVHPQAEKLPAAGLVELRREIDPSALNKGLVAKTSQVDAGQVLERPVKGQLQPMLNPLETAKPATGEVSGNTQTSKASSGAATVTPLRASTGSVDGAAVRVGLPAFQAAVLHEVSQPVDPTQTADRARMVDAILRAGGGELRQVAGKVLQLRLNPPELGRVQIRAEQRGGELVMRFEVERLETLKVFQDVMPGLELSLGQASGETVSLELSQTDEFSEMGEDIGEDHQEHASDESADFSEADETEDEAPFDVLRDGSTVQVTA